MSNQTDSQTHDPKELYGYIPNYGASVFFLVLFGASTLVHAIQALLIKPRMYWILPTTVMCGLGELTGWSGRLWSSKNPFNENAYSVQIVCTIVSPVFLTAAMYTILSRIIPFLGPEYSRFRPKTYLKLFVTGDILALLVQVGGGTLASGPDASDKLLQVAQWVMLGGIFLQLLFMLFFALLGIEILVRVRKNKPFKKWTTSIELEGFPQRTTEGPHISRRVRKMITGLFITTILVFIRTGYRAAELKDGFNGHIIRTQVYFILGDAVPIFLALLALNIYSAPVLLRQVPRPNCHPMNPVSK